jgi:hypothetical protein
VATNFNPLPTFKNFNIECIIRTVSIVIIKK